MDVIIFDTGIFQRILGLDLSALILDDFKIRKEIWKKGSEFPMRTLRFMTGSRQFLCMPPEIFCDGILKGQDNDFSGFKG